MRYGRQPWKNNIWIHRIRAGQQRKQISGGRRQFSASKNFKNISAEAVKGIGVDGVCHSPVLVDQDGELLQRDIQLYCDKRNADIVERCRTDYKARGIWEETGNVPACNWMGMKIRWIKENEPELYEKAACILSAKDYINLRLTGITGTDPSEASEPCF